jgi:hypothetical protein
MAGGCAAASAITTLGLGAFSIASNSVVGLEAVLSYLVWFALSFGVTMLFSGTAGLGWHTFCQARGWTSVHYYWIAGALLGAALGGLWYLPAGSYMLVAILVPYGVTLGGLTGAFAWLIRRPDRDAANPATATP